MKKISLLVIAALLAFTLSACGSATLTNFAVEQTEYNLEVGEQAQITILDYIFDKNVEGGKYEKSVSALPNVIYLSDSENIASVSENGVISATEKGTAIITVDLNGIVKEITVNVTVPLVALETKETDIELIENGTYVLEISPAPANADYEPIIYTSKNEEIATVDKNGKITAVSAGETVIEFKSGEISNFVTVTVSPLIENISLEQAEGMLYIGLAHQLVPTVAPEELSVEFEYSSSDPTIVTVDENGLITAKTAGTAVITVSVKNYPNVFIEYTVTVTPAPRQTSTGGSARDGSGTTGNNGNTATGGGSATNTEAPPPSGGGETPAPASETPNPDPPSYGDQGDGTYIYDGEDANNVGEQPDW